MPNTPPPKTIGREQIARDRDLVRRILRNEPVALRSFYDDYFPKLFRYASRRMNSPADVDDVVQSALAIAARTIDRYRGEATLLTWLIQICRSEVARHYRSTSHRDAHGARVPLLLDDVLRAAVESLEANPDDEPESAAHRAELVARVQVALDQLPVQYASVLELKYLHDFTSKEIAARIGVNDEAAQSLLARARRAFREVCGMALAFNEFGTADQPL